ncbi:MAG: mitochondrial fission ELM1 family protein [Verrucomicrobia bacterium]|nr:mitochondrial fission ELM1 family protein [Verrucomicrobiota bacterium]
MKKIAILYDGRPGHLTASKGVLQSFEKLAPTEHAIINVRLRIKFLRRPLRALLNRQNLIGRISPAFQNQLIRFCYKLDADLESIKEFDWIVSTGGDTSFLNAWLAKIYGVKNIYCSSLRGLAPSLFTWLISTRTTPAEPNEIRLSVSPVPIDRLEIAEQGRRLRAELHKETQRLWAVLIGGDGSGYRYDRSSMEKLAAGLLELAERNHAQLLITTSRRTGARLEHVLRAFFAGHPEVAYASFYNYKPEKVVTKFLGAAEIIFCTTESSSMLSESMASGKPVYTLIPEVANPEPRYQTLLQEHTEKHHIKPLLLSELPETDVQRDIAEYFQVLEQDPTSELAGKLKLKLG